MRSRLFQRPAASVPPSRTDTPDTAREGGAHPAPAATSTSFGGENEVLPVGDGAEALFETHHVPYALLLATVTPLLLLTLNLLWESKMSRGGALQAASQLADKSVRPPSLPIPLLADLERWLEERLQSLTIEWAVRNLIGGVSAGVALAVLMPSSPFLTVVVLTAGWYVQATVRIHLGFPLAEAQENMTGEQLGLMQSAWCAM